MFDSAIGTLELFAVYLGRQLGLYDALRDGAAMTPDDLAGAAGIAPRYAREWLEQQAVAGYLEVEDARAGAAERRYRLPPEHAGALCDAEHPEHVAPIARMVVGVAGALPEVVDAYRSGGGVPYARYGDDLACGQGAINRPLFVRDLPQRWVPAMPEIHRVLDGGGRVVDVACGHAWSTIALARRYPRARVLGVDADDASIVEARANVAAAGVEVELACGDAANLADRGPFDVAFVFEALHDMARPVQVLTAVRAALADGGSVVVVDERVAETFTAPGDAVERIMYGWSVTHCLPVGLAEAPSAATGTVLRPHTVRDYALRAGFRDVVIAPIEHELFRVYRLVA